LGLCEHVSITPEPAEQPNFEALHLVLPEHARLW